MKNITIIGMSGFGKSTVGRIAAMGTRQFIDVDDLIRAVYPGKSLDDLIETKGPEWFLDEEARIICEYAWPKHRSFVVAPGGSAVYRPDAMRVLKQQSTIVHLDAPFVEIAKRVDFENRGIVSPCNLSFEEECQARQSMYEMWADVTVSALDSPVGVAMKIRSRLAEAT